MDELEKEKETLKAKIKEKDLQLKLYEESLVKNNSDAYVIEALQSSIQKYEQQKLIHEQKEENYKNTIKTLKEKLNRKNEKVDFSKVTFEDGGEIGENINNLKAYILEKEKDISELENKYNDLNLLYEATMDILVDNERQIQEKEHELESQKEKTGNTEVLLETLKHEMEKLKVCCSKYRVQPSISCCQSCSKELD